MRILPGLLLCLSVCSTRAQVAVRLDDSASPHNRVVAAVSWENKNNALGMTTEALNTMIAVLDDVEIRLDTTKFEGARARIFLRLPASVRGLRGVDGLRMRWTTEGVFKNGEVVPGDRALIFDGVIPQRPMSDIFDFKLRIDARDVVHGLNFEPIYEIEVF